MFKKILVAAASSMFALSAFAVDANQVEKSVQLRDGSTVHIFADGKMAMESKFGRATYMEAGHVMDTKDGKNLVMNGNEAARLDQLLNKNVSGG
jgi:Copper resistance protein K